MTAQNRATLYNYFLTGDKPNQNQFTNLIDSCINLVDSASQAIQSTITLSSGNLVFNGNTSGTVTISSPAIAGSTSFILPANNGTSGYFLQTNGLGATSWVASSTSNPLTLGVNGGTGGSITLNGASTGSCAIQVDANAGSGTNFKLPTNNGSASQVLTTDGSGNTSWSTSSTGGGLVLLNTQNASGASSVSFSSTLITATYNKYIVEFDGIFFSTTNQVLQLTFSTNNGMSYLASNYAWANASNRSGSSAFSGSASSSDSSIPLGATIGAVSTVPSAGTIKLSDLSGSNQPNINFQIAGLDATLGVFNQIGSGTNTGTISINNIKFTPSSGTVTGNFHLYGIVGT